jgi:DNA-binding helix-turn-helix protein
MRIDRFKLAHAMIDRDISVSTLAERTHLSRATVSGIKNGRSCIRKTAEKIADALDVPLNKLLEDK